MSATRLPRRVRRAGGAMIAATLLVTCGCDCGGSASVVAPPATVGDDVSEETATPTPGAAVTSGAPATPPAPGCRALDESGLPDDSAPLLAGVRMRLVGAHGRTRFEQGELIGVELHFEASGDAVGRYVVDAATYDRSGRQTSETFFVEPDQGVVDPLEDYFSDGMFMGGGLRAIPALGAEPIVISRDVSEHLRFDRPGTYALRVRSTRLGLGEGEDRDTAPFGFECGAEPLTLEIAPRDEARAAARLAEALATLDRAGASEDEHAAALRTLRFLDTEAAARAMVSRMTTHVGEDDFQLSFGLIGSPHRALVLQLLREALDLPDASVSRQVFYTLVRLSVHADEAEQPAEGDISDEARWAARRERQTRITAAMVSALRDALPRKRGAAADASAATLLEVSIDTPAATSSAGARDPDRAALASGLVRMSSADRDRFMGARWRAVGGAELRPALVSIFEDASEEEHVRAVALRRLCELDPIGERPRVEAEIRRTPAGLGYLAREVLLCLPPGPSAAGSTSTLDDAVATGIERRDFEVLLRSRLLARYGSPAILARVRASRDGARERVDTDSEGGIWAYLLRVDRARTLTELRAFAQASIAPEAPPHERFRVVGTLQALDGLLAVSQWSVELDRMVIPYLRAPAAALTGSESDAVMAPVTAAALLRDRGGDEAKEALLLALEALRATLGRRTLLRGGAWQLEDALFGALRGGLGWRLDAAAIGRLRAACVSDECRAAAESMDAAGGADPLPVHVVLFEDGSVMANWDSLSRTSTVEVTQAGAAGTSASLARSFELPAAAPFAGGVRVRARALDELFRGLEAIPRSRPVVLTIEDNGDPDIATLRRALRAAIESTGRRVQ